ncbi:translational GTPase TypA [Candidatus Methylacidiphilum infernorum]|uniref:Large ribosomal subunit assembly factor BipA n=1 Tax=Methylacidiphilum infernorum (isolate V4) TaxID=481448 RepID=B3DVY2_METI4|nr:translational GTPase TypA [Candidatus Methylacidiphilum infernorum]ACD83485.1 Translation regulatory factor BipA (GTPase) [Methylacidiphilum infernorum V4]
MKKMRNIAIIAHVDHGKTTLVDQLLKQSGAFRQNQQLAERIMDSLDLEKEKGITIKAKNASFQYKDYKINIVDTPGHADFGSEVERSLGMVDGVLLLVDSVEGPQAQTKFVLKKAIARDLTPLVLINKIDRANAQPIQVLDQIFELFLELEASDKQLDFPVLYVSAKEGIALKEWKKEITDEDKRNGFSLLFEAIVTHIPAPTVYPDPAFKLLVANLDYSDYLGRIAIGKIFSGKIKVGSPLFCHQKSAQIVRGNVTAILGFKGLERVELDEASAGDIVGIAGLEEVYIGDTLSDSETIVPLPRIEIDPPTVRMRIVVNDSPLAGREGKFLTARHIYGRLQKEARTNVGLSVQETDIPGTFEVCGRGMMQIAVLVEQMRREGFELMVSRPEVIYKEDPSGIIYEPFEILSVDIPQENLGAVMEMLSKRAGNIRLMRNSQSRVFIECLIPTRGLIGFESEFINLTRAEGYCSHLFYEYGPKQGEVEIRESGVLVSMERGVATTYALENLQQRGVLFIGPGEEVYEGMVVGENKRPDDLLVNPCKAKHLTNIRSQGEGKAIGLEPPRRFRLEEAIEFIDGDELVEVTPTKIRIRKKILDAHERKKASLKVGS